MASTPQQPHQPGGRELRDLRRRAQRLVYDLVGQQIWLDHAIDLDG